ncbi:ATP-binding cassette domain-containing protein [Borrelia miyamotoi]|uniref:Probable ATP-binding protein YbiT n=1 Tax=Borrelia miyamotoi TaxID=47466 RepID=A0AAX3JLN3_9SPIR|nr:ATP-binding cassette domain-containing protein [Borrelia miyamotoi]QFP41635.1 ATP-binding cassette domain-containing protein [Borrelia miyamotoi]QFP47755.1 ATP-binding cassette domain-containing protein [Borrelia miyamotoi]QGT55515.1 ATP-binding cassette domain-containing protein [Borrelia miyamotoi]QGT56297.1 ATP-binding cassette domain-containing protein [Borrelia miyamotoi]WAZ71545.1 ATP-binding cassette domain-containing protein [Borrelia miyamotoi]
MITVSNLEVAFGERILFKDVNIKFFSGNCYGIIGANGAGKSTFLKVLGGTIEPSKGEVLIAKNQRMAVLEQNQFAYDDFKVIDTVIMGHKKLYAVQRERDEIYEKSDFSDEDGIRAGELEAEFAEFGGYEAESNAAVLLKGLGINESLHSILMRDIEAALKVRVLLAQAIFGDPDILLLDEPTNNLDIQSIKWLEEFLINFENTVIVVSHDRHFLNQVCTHIVDIDYGKIQIYLGNYDFWYETSQILNKQLKDAKKRSEEKIAELKAFIQRFSSNASKSRQATSRKKLIDKIKVEDLKPSLRKFPYLNFKTERELGKNVITIKNLTKEFEGQHILNKFSIIIEPGQKVVFLGSPISASSFFDIISNEDRDYKGHYEWGTTVNFAYFKKDNERYFNVDLSLIDWLRQYSKEQDETYIRGFLGRMLFSQDEALKKVNVLSGGEKVRCMLSKIMLSGANVLLLDQPTNHLDLEAITSLNTGLQDFKGVVLFTSHDHQFIDTVANRIIEFTPNGIIDRFMTFSEYVDDYKVKELRDRLYEGHTSLKL